MVPKIIFLKNKYLPINKEINLFFCIKQYLEIHCWHEVNIIYEFTILFESFTIL